MRSLSVFQPLAGPSALDLRADPDLWLPEGSRASGPRRWRVPLRLGGLTRTVLSEIGTPTAKKEAVWRRVSWSPDSEHGDAVPVERLLPDFDGEIGLTDDPPTLVIHGDYRVPMGIVGEAIDAAVLHRAARHTASRLLAEIAARLDEASPDPDRLPPSRRQPIAVVVDENPDLCSVLGESLHAQGYHVVTCLGPVATWCEGARAGTEAAKPCRCVPPEAEIVVLGAAAARSRLPEAFRTWFPDAEIRLDTSV